MVYLDNSATTRMDEAVLEAMIPWMREQYGNASSVYALGRTARVMIENAREEFAHLIHAHPAELIFTSGGTESNNTVLKSVCEESGLARTLAVSSVEHHAVLHPAEELAQRGVTLHIMSVDAHGTAEIERLRDLSAKNILVSLMHGNNETGAIQPVERLREILTHIPRAYIHTDAVQSFGKVPFDVQALNLDFATFSAHKIHGPKGIGALFIRKGIDFKAHQQGGAQERNRRAGTESPALVAGFITAARNATSEMHSRSEQMCKRVTLLRALLTERVNAIRFNTPPNALPHILNVSFLDAAALDGEAIVQAMDMRGVAVSNGSACVSGSQQPSHVLAAMGLPDAEARAAVRFSVSKDTTEAEVRTAVDALAEIMNAIRDES
jgi:cysteine desulfurase